MMSQRQRQGRVIPRLSNKEFIFKLLRESKSSKIPITVSQHHRQWTEGVIFGGEVRDMIMGLNQKENDIDIGVAERTADSVISILERQDRLRVDYGIEKSITNTIYPVRSIEADLPQHQKSIQFVYVGHPMFNEICDFTVNNLMYGDESVSINARVVIKGMTRVQTLALCMSDINDGLLRFMMPEEISCSCRRHYVSTKDQDWVGGRCNYKSKFSISCDQCRLVFLEQQLKLIERLNKMLNKTHPETGENLFRLAEEPNFPPYFPKQLCKEEVQDEKCPICMEDFDNLENTVITTCGHKYCASCMYTHVNSSTQLTEFGRKDKVCCPVCRAEVVLQTLGDSRVSLQASEE